MKRDLFYRGLGVLLPTVLWSGAAQAVILTNGVNTVFSDSFENNVTAPNDSDPDPALWGVNENDSDHNTVLGPGNGGPRTPDFANDGDNYMKLYRGGGGESNIFHEFFGNPQTSGQLKLELAVWQAQSANQIDTGYAVGGTVVLAADTSDGNGFPTASVWVGAWRESNSVSNTLRAYYGDQWNDITIDGTSTVLTWTPETWMHWQIDLDLNAINRTYTLTVDGVTSNPIPVKETGDIASLVIRNSSEGTVFNVDAVPEPGSAAILLMGATVAGLARRRR